MEIYYYWGIDGRYFCVAYYKGVNVIIVVLFNEKKELMDLTNFI